MKESGEDARMREEHEALRSGDPLRRTLLKRVGVVVSDASTENAGKDPSERSRKMPLGGDWRVATKQANGQPTFVHGCRAARGGRVDRRMGGWVTWKCTRLQDCSTVEAAKKTRVGIKQDCWNS